MDGMHTEHNDHKAHIAKSYDLVAGDYAANFYDELDRKPFDRDILKRFSDLTRYGTVCDMGCGPGEVAAFLKKCGADVFGIDLSGEMVAEAKRLAPDITFIQGDIFNLPLEDNSLSGIAAFYSIVNYKINSVGRAFSEFHRALASNGTLLVAFHAGHNKIIKVKRFFNKDIHVQFCYFNPNDIIKKLTDSGFSIEEAIVRHPYKDEHPTKRAYILARKAALNRK